VYVEKSEGSAQQKPLIGVDMGCETSLTLSNGVKINVQVGETGRLKGLQRKLAGCKKGSNNRRRVKRQIRKESQHVSNIRCDKAHKTLHALSAYRVVMQDEQLAGWAENGHGKKVQHGILGRVKAGLESRPDTFVISRWVPTTKLCTECGEKVDLSLHDRTFVCPHCGHTEDRDVHAAKNMVWYFLHKSDLCVGRTEYGREEFTEQLNELFMKTSHETAESLAQR
jgi:putative transposase